MVTECVHNVQQSIFLILFHSCSGCKINHQPSYKPQCKPLCLLHVSALSPLCLQVTLPAHSSILSSNQQDVYNLSAGYCPLLRGDWLRWSWPELPSNRGKTEPQATRTPTLRHVGWKYRQRLWVDGWMEDSWKPNSGLSLWRWGKWIQWDINKVILRAQGLGTVPDGLCKVFKL